MAVDGVLSVEGCSLSAVSEYEALVFLERPGVQFSRYLALAVDSECTDDPLGESHLAADRVLGLGEHQLAWFTATLATLSGPLFLST